MDIGMRTLHPAAADHSVSIKGSRCTALIHPFASEPSGSGWSYWSPFYRRVFWKMSAMSTLVVLVSGERGPETGNLEIEETARQRWWVTSPSPGGGPGGESCCYVLLELFRTQNISKVAISQSLGLKRRTVVNRASRDRFPPPLSPAGRSELPKSTLPAHSWNQVRAVALESPLQVVTGRAVTSLKAGSCVPPARGGIWWVLCSASRPRPLPSQTPGWVPVFHLAAPPRVRQWSRWSR